MNKITFMQYKQIRESLQILEEVQGGLDRGELEWESVVEDAKAIILQINNMLWECTELKQDYSFDELLSIYIIFVDEQINCTNDIDRQFNWLMKYVEMVDYNDIVLNVKKALCDFPQERLPYLQHYYQTYNYFWGNLDISQNDYSVIENRVSVLINCHDDFAWLYNKLADYRSKNVLVLMLKHWITFDWNLIVNMRENNFCDYYDPDIVKHDKDEVIVDLGAYDGDSARDFVEAFGEYKRIYCYEITPSTIIKLKEKMADYHDIVICEKGVSDEKGEMYIEDSNIASSETLLKSDGSIRVPVVTIDEDVNEPITMLKMDIEGAEQSALRGSRNHIINDRPKLLVCVYHGNTDIVEIPRLIDSMRDDYKFYLRSNGVQYGPAEIVLFAV